MNRANRSEYAANQLLRETMQREHAHAAGCTPREPRKPKRRENTARRLLTLVFVR
jgi:hypothetical protein